jgi:hypothetical protein
MRIRRTFWCAALAFGLALGGVGCRRHKAAAKATDDSAPGRIRSVVDMNNVQAAGQLVAGFHSIEAGAWRWTEREFSVSLARPLRAGENGAILTVRLTVPPITIEKLKSIQLSAKVNGSPVDPETYTAPGNYVYRREVPASMLAEDPVRVDFALDKAIPPGNPDIRELGLVVLSIGLASR